MAMLWRQFQVYSGWQPEFAYSGPRKAIDSNNPTLERVPGVQSPGIPCFFHLCGLTEGLAALSFLPKFGRARVVPLAAPGRKDFANDVPPTWNVVGGDVPDYTTKRTISQGVSHLGSWGSQRANVLTNSTLRGLYTNLTLQIGRVKFEICPKNLTRQMHKQQRPSARNQEMHACSGRRARPQLYTNCTPYHHRHRSHMLSSLRPGTSLFRAKKRPQSSFISPTGGLHFL